MNWAGVAVRPIMRASKYWKTSLYLLKMERCTSSKMIRSKKPGENCSKQLLSVCKVAAYRRLIFECRAVNACAGFIRQKFLKAVRLGLLDQLVPVGHEQDIAGLVGAQKHVDQRHNGAGFAGAGGHHDQRLTLAGFEGFAQPADGFVLVSPVGNDVVDGNAAERFLVLAHKQ